MISHWLLYAALLAVAGWIARLLIGKFSQVPRISKTLLIVGIGTCVAGIGLTMAAGVELDRFAEFKKWRTTDGTIVAAEMTGNRTFRPQITYRYEIDGKVFTGESNLDVPGFGGKRKMFEVAQANIDSHKPGSRVMVFVNPADPTISKLRVTPTWDIFGRIGFGLILSFLGAFTLSLPRKLTSR